MGKNRDLESLIKLIVNIVVHEIVIRHTNRPESKHFLDSEIIEYRSQTEKTAKSHNWNNEDKKYVEEKALEKIKEKLGFKYPDINYSEQEAIKKLKEMINDLM